MQIAAARGKSLYLPGEFIDVGVHPANDLGGLGHAAETGAGAVGRQRGHWQ